MLNCPICAKRFHYTNDTTLTMHIDSITKWIEHIMITHKEDHSKYFYAEFLDEVAN